MRDSTSALYNCSITLTSMFGALAMRILILFNVDFPLIATCFLSSNKHEQHIKTILRSRIQHNGVRTQ
jgi:hypothetical protein